MNDSSFTTTMTLDQTPEQAFAAILNVRGWWSEDIEGRTDTLGSEFTYRYKDVHRCTLRMTELIPSKRVVWHVLENYFSFIPDESEWKETKIIFDLSRKGSRTEIRFTHQGLVPQNACYAVCHDGWTTYINGSLRDLIATGKGKPNTGKAQTAGERAHTA